MWDVILIKDSDSRRDERVDDTSLRLRAAANLQRPLASSCAHVRPLRHSEVHLFAHWSFQDGTEWGMLHTLRWHASVHASVPEEPHTVTHVFGVGSCRRRRVVLRVPDRNGSRSASMSRASRPKDARAEGDAKSEVKESVSGRFAFAGPDATPRRETNPKNAKISATVGRDDASSADAPSTGTRAA